jgi:hypothetical protein
MSLAPQPGDETVAEFFAKTGELPRDLSDLRRFPRFYFRSCAEATIHPPGGGPPTRCFLLTRDLSRCGVCLVHTQQLYPAQRMELVLNGQPPRLVEVVWCRRWIDGRYFAGCRFVKEEEC